MPNHTHNRFESDAYLVQVASDHLFYAEKTEVIFDFRSIARLRIHRRKSDGKVTKITYRVKGQLVPFQIDGFSDPDMERMAAMLKIRAEEFSIPVSDSRSLRQ